MIDGSGTLESNRRILSVPALMSVCCDRAHDRAADLTAQKTKRTTASAIPSATMISLLGEKLLDVLKAVAPLMQKVFGIQIEPEKEILLTVIPAAIKDAVLREVVRATRLDVPGHGISFIVPVEMVAGIVHLIEQPSP